MRFEASPLLISSIIPAPFGSGRQGSDTRANSRPCDFRSGKPLHLDDRPRCSAPDGSSATKLPRAARHSPTALPLALLHSFRRARRHTHTHTHTHRLPCLPHQTHLDHPPTSSVHLHSRWARQVRVLLGLATACHWLPTCLHPTIHHSRPDEPVHHWCHPRGRVIQLRRTALLDWLGAALAGKTLTPLPTPFETLPPRKLAGNSSTCRTAR